MTRYVEVRQVVEASELSLDLARHLACRLLVGQVAILTKRPSVFAAVLGKRWLSVLRDMEREHASTLNPIRRRELARELKLMRSAVFTSRLPWRVTPNQVLIVASVAGIPKGCPTVYAAYQLTPARLKFILELLPESGVLVMYGAWNNAHQQIAETIC
jgi:hypothetical protein